MEYSAEDILEMYGHRLVMFRGTKREFLADLKEALVRYGEARIGSTIKFFNRRHHNNRLKEKAALDNKCKELISKYDDLLAENAEFWKQHNAHYRYFYKDVPRR